MLRGDKKFYRANWKKPLSGISKPVTLTINLPLVILKSHVDVMIIGGCCTIQPFGIMSRGYSIGKVKLKEPSFGIVVAGFTVSDSPTSY